MCLFVLVSYADCIAAATCASTAIQCDELFALCHTHQHHELHFCILDWNDGKVCIFFVSSSSLRLHFHQKTYMVSILHAIFVTSGLLPIFLLKQFFFCGVAACYTDFCVCGNNDKGYCRYKP
jgi:hypothetical protein